jgi:3-deoxy-manno-octulosonate cytidylyltransferase (CMP-KDO synthetase)
MKTVGIIPARYASTRLPGKPLADLGGKPVIQHTYERACQALDLVLVATDDRRILKAVEGFGGRAQMTRPDHACGSERVAEVAAALQADVIVNVQGDEPFIDPDMIRQAVAPLAQEPEVVVTTLSRAILDEGVLHSPGTVKVVTDRRGDALYFSRSLIPYPRHPEFCAWREHVGLYAYRREFLLEFVQWPATPLEQAESLEQLRILENGYPIRVVETERGAGAPCIDTPEDLARARAYLSKLGASSGGFALS